MSVSLQCTAKSYDGFVRALASEESASAAYAVTHCKGPFLRALSVTILPYGAMTVEKSNMSADGIVLEIGRSGAEEDATRV